MRTYVEMRDPGALRPAPRPYPTAAVDREPCTPATYRDLYHQVGYEWHWRDRAEWSDEQLRLHLARPQVSIFVLRVDGSAAGFFELLRHDDQSVEIAYFGLLPAWIGRRLGAFLLTRAVEEAWRLGAVRVWLHTCTLDHPAALPNYLARGFQATRTERYLLVPGST